MKYKIAILGDNIFSEVKLNDKWEKGIYIGTTNTSHMRFHKKMFPVDFEIKVFAQNGQWQAECSENVCLQNEMGQNSKVYFDVLERWKVINVKTEDYLFSIEFDIDFEKKCEDFYTKICCENADLIRVGASDQCNIRIDDPVLGRDSFTIAKENGTYILHSENSRYGVLLNGTKCREEKKIISDRDIISINGFDFYWHEGALFTGSNLELISKFETVTKKPQSNHLHYPNFVRSARQQFVVPEKEIKLLAPSAKPVLDKRNIVTSLLPSLISVGMMVLMRAAMGGRNVMYIFMCVGMGLTGIITSIISLREGKIKYRKDLVSRENDYNRYIADQEKKIQELQEKERIISKRQYPGIDERIREVEDFDQRLFEKQKENKDFLYVQLGVGAAESKVAVESKEQDTRQVNDPLMDYPQLFHDKYQFVADMPIMLDLAENRTVGFIGKRTQLYQMMKNLILQMCIEHYYQDLKTVFIMEEDDVENFRWARWFRNAYDEKSGLRYFAYDKNSNKVILEYLYSFLNERSKRKEAENKEDSTYVIFVYRSEIIEGHPINLFVEKAKDLNCVFLFFDEYVEYVNRFCKKRVFLSEKEMAGYIQDIDDGEKVDIFEYNRVPIETAAAVAQKMASVNVEEVSLEAALTKNISMYQLLDIGNVRELDLSSRWANSRIYNTMAAPLGVKSGNEIVYLDLHEKFHGPHGLVAGTTGSGKSEILQTYILSMATLFHPYEVGFIIIDFKGGGMVNQFRNLPHLNGAITNIDGKEIDRSLSSIKAELQKRQRYFALHDVNHIDDYIRLFKSGKAKEPLPHLILIVDEFAELKSEQPEFMKELISAARIGRSLGVHLILATQKPSGVVNDQIWSNSKFKLCLKVQDKSDSNEVLKSPLAAEIREPGRAYLQVGNNEIFQLFQSAYSGAPVPNGAMGKVKKFKINSVELSGQRMVVFEQKQQAEEGGKNQLDAIVEYIADYCKVNKIERLPNICMPPLSDNIEYNLVPYENKSTDVCIPLGIYDAPQRQAQELMDVNLTQSHVMIIGSSQMGKTNMLTCIIRGLAERYSSDEVEIYLLDYASMILKNFEKLKHVGDVVTSSDDDKAKDLLAKLVAEIQRRKDILSEMGLSSYSAYRESGQTELNQKVIILDNIMVFRELNNNLEDSMLKLARDGAAVGICLIVTAQQTNGLGYRYMSNFSNRFCFYCNDSSEYSSVFERCRQKLDQKPGRCFFTIDKEIYEGQIYVPFPAQKEIERVTKIREFIGMINENDKGKGAEKLPTLPDEVSLSDLWDKSETEWEPYMFPLGYNFDNYGVDVLQLSDFPILGLVGGKAEVKVSFLKVILEELLSKQAKAPADIYIFDDSEGSFAAYKDRITYYSSDATTVIECVKKICRSALDNPGNSKYSCLILNSDQVVSFLSEDDETYNLICECLSSEAVSGVSFILPRVKNESLYLAKDRLVKLLNDANNMLVFEKLSEAQVIEWRIKNKQKRGDRELKPQEAWFVSGDYCAMYKIPLSK
ncbi:MAG: type VII secretion protein EssC [Lachnospiraceae bacterium]|nr:type VII secretion protein EssC [Lachnospiraceae bacterium]